MAKKRYRVFIGGSRHSPYVDVFAANKAAAFVEARRVDSLAALPQNQGKLTIFSTVKRNPVKKRKSKKRGAKRSGHSIVVTTSSRVVKTTRMNPHLSHADARKLFDKYNKAREREDAPTEAQRRARNEATVKRMRGNPYRLRYQTQRQLDGAFVRAFVRRYGRKPTDMQRRWGRTEMGLGTSPSVAAQRVEITGPNPCRPNPVRSLVVPRKMWSRLKRNDRRTKNGHRYVRCKTRRARRAFWLPCTIR